MTGEGERNRRTGRPEVDELLDTADAEHRATAGVVAVNRAENAATDGWKADLVAAHEQLYRRVTETEAELSAAKAADDPARYAVARDAYDVAYAEFNSTGRALIGQMQGLIGAQQERTGALFAQMDAARRAENAAMEALTGRRRLEPPGPADPTDAEGTT